jgi:hypothetical protein
MIEPPGLSAAGGAPELHTPVAPAPLLSSASSSHTDMLASVREVLGPRDKLPPKLHAQCQHEAESLASRMRRLLKLRHATEQLEAEITQLTNNELPKGMRPTTLQYVTPEHSSPVAPTLGEFRLSLAGCTYESAYQRLHVFSNLVHRSLSLAVAQEQIAGIRPLLEFGGFRERCNVFADTFFDAIDTLQADLGIEIPRPPPLKVSLPDATCELLFSTVCRTVAEENAREKDRVRALATQRQKTLDDVNALTGRQLLDYTIEEKVASLQKASRPSAKPAAKAAKAAPKKMPGVIFASALDELTTRGTVSSVSLAPQGQDAKGKAKGKGKDHAKGKGKGKGKGKADPSSLAPPPPGKGKGKGKGKSKGDSAKGKGKGKGKGKDGGKGKGKSSKN